MKNEQRGQQTTELTLVQVGVEGTPFATVVMDGSGVAEKFRTLSTPNLHSLLSRDFGSVSFPVRPDHSRYEQVRG